MKFRQLQQSLAARATLRRGPQRRSGRGRGRRMLKQRIKGFTVQQSLALRRAIHRNDETKYIATQVADLNFSAPIGSAADCVPLVPKIVQGTDDFQRIGRKVKPVRSYVDVFLGFNQNIDGSPLQTSQQIYAVLYVVTSKIWKNFNNLPTGPGIFDKLLDNGDGTSSAFQGSLTDLAKPINEDEFRGLRKIVVKLTRNPGLQNNANVAGGGLSTNLYTMSARVRIPVKLPTLTYDDTTPPPTTGSYPVNCAPVMCIGWCYTDGSLVGLADAVLHVNARHHVWYKDA